MTLSRDKSSELSLLMELRLAFGPGTRLWANRSLEELCYDWLRFKERKANACFREFALGLYLHERGQAPQLSGSQAVLRRVVTVLRAYGIKRCHRIMTSIFASPQPRTGSRSQKERDQQTLVRGRLPVAAVVFPDATSLPLSAPLRDSEVAR